MDEDLEFTDIEENGELGDEDERDADEAEPGIDPGLLELAEEPALWLPQEPQRLVFYGDRFAFVASGRSAWVHRLRLEDEDEEQPEVTSARVNKAVGHVAAILAMKSLPEAVWWVGELSTPSDLTDRLIELGLEPADPPEMTTLTIAEPPAGEPEIDVRRVETLEDHLAALELDWEAFAIPAEERELRRGEAEQGWAAIQADGRQSTYIAYLDDEPVGFGRAVYTPRGGLLLGGATLPQARGQGVYTALVHARWAEAVDRGTPRLVVAAGPESAPILEGLEFQPIGGVRLLRQRV